MHADDTDDDDDEFLHSSKHQQFVAFEDKTEEDVDSTSPSQEVPQMNSKKKPVTKFAVVKKLLKKKVQLNQRIEFDEDGEMVLDPTKTQVMYQKTIRYSLPTSLVIKILVESSRM